MFRFDIHLQGVFLIVYHDALGISLEHHCLKLCIGCLCLDAGVAIAACEIQHSQHHHHQKINPVHIELRHLHVRPLVVIII